MFSKWPDFKSKWLISRASMSDYLLTEQTRHFYRNVLMSTIPGKPQLESYPEFAGTHLLLVDDDPEIHTVVDAIVASMGLHLSCATTIREARSAAGKRRFDMALVDMVLPDANGIDCIACLKKACPDISIIVITGHADRDMAYSLENTGIRNVLTKPFSASQLRFTLCKEMARRKLLEKEGALHPQAADGQGVGLIGNSSYIKRLREKIAMFARSDIPVLIEGPTGTGKEIIAAAIHHLSSRCDKPMIVVNSSAIPEHLEESELFGHAKGAFTGAHKEKEGIIACADGSSLFLDEVGELSLRIQAKLLRVLDGHGYTRVGESLPRTADFRLISATNRPLRNMIDEGSFRQDLYFRLKSGIIETRPLCSHKDDIPLLVRHFLYETSRNRQKEFIITGEALATLHRYEWPGNIRELKHVVETLCSINNKSLTITAESIEWVIPGTTEKNDPLHAPFSEAKAEFEVKFYTDLLARHNGNITASAMEAGIDRPNFSKKLKVMGIKAAVYKPQK
jgi:two-component system, NtrC family, response regulator AtoC